MENAMHEPTRGSDPTQMRNQSSFWTSAGTSWLIVGGITLVLVGGMLIALAVGDLGRESSLWSLAALGACYLAMLIVRVAVAQRHARLIAMFALYLGMIAAGFVGVWLAIGAATL